VTKRKVILKLGEVNEFQLELIRHGWERLGSYPGIFSVTLVKEFYVIAKVITSAAPTFLSYVKGEKVPFDAETINEFLGTQLADDVECQFSALDDEGMVPKSCSEHSAYRVKDFIKARFSEVPFTPWPDSDQLLCTLTYLHALMCLISRRDTSPSCTPS